MIEKQYINYLGEPIPEIKGAKGKGGGKIVPNSLFSTDILYLTNAIGEGPIYRINPNGPQDIQIQDSSIDDLLRLDTNGEVDTTKFLVAYTSGTTTQAALPKFGNESVTPQGFSAPVSLKKGNIAGVPSSSITLQETSANAWDALRFTFMVNELYLADKKGNVSGYTTSILITIYDYLANPIMSKTVTITGKTDTTFKQSVLIDIPEVNKDVGASTYGYKFSITKDNNDSSDSYVHEDVRIIGWDEIQHISQAYPRTAVIGYAIKATDEHTGGIPNFTTMVKGLLVKVPSNYNQPILASGEIDWQQLELPTTGTATIKGVATTIGYTQKGYRLQKTGTGTVAFTINPQIYVGTWDGTFVYSWTQNPVWIIYDLLTNTTYGLGIPEENIDKFAFYKIAQYCDACDPITGKFIGVDGLADGSYRNKPRTLYTAVREKLIGLPVGTPIKERRFILDVSISEQEKAIDTLNKLAASFRSMLVYAGGKISLASDMPEEYPVMLFNEATIKSGTFQISGNKESDIVTGVDATYIDPTNHFKRETVRVDSVDANDGTDSSEVENIASIDLTGVTRRSQAMRSAQYHLASSKYLRRNVSFTASTDALQLSPGDVISVSSQGTGIAYGFGGKVYADSALTTSTNTNVFLEHFTVPSLTLSNFTANTNPLALRIIKQSSDKVDMYLISNTDFSLSTTANVVSGYDQARVKVISRYDPKTKIASALASGFTSNIKPETGDLWSFGEIVDPSNFYSSKAGKLFKVTSLKRETDNEVAVNAIEYVSNVYVDSDTFIDYEPTAYTDITSPFSTPPTPIFSFATTPRITADGSIVIDGVLKNRNEISGYGQKFETEYFIASPNKSMLVSNVTSASPLTIKVANAEGLENGLYSTRLSGKTGFTSALGEIKLLCNNITQLSPDKIELTIEGLSSCIDKNFNKHVLAVNDGSIPSLKGIDQITIPVIDKVSSESALNFVGYNPTISTITQPIVSYDTSKNTLVITDILAGASTLYTAMPSEPFYVSISQILAKNYYANNSFYVTGSSFTYVQSGTVVLNSVNTFELDVKPRAAALVRLYIDGIPVNPETVNINASNSMKANVTYSVPNMASEYRTEVDYYSVPVIEMGDQVEISQGNVFSVVTTSYDPTSNEYSAALTSNNIYRITISDAPSFDASGYSITNNSLNPVGVTANVSGTTCILNYDTEQYPGTFRLANNGVYRLETGSVFEKLFLTSDLTIPNLPLGVTTVRAKNRNTLGRLSPFVEKSVDVRAIPIQKVEQLELTESLYREQTGGVAVKITCSFVHILNQGVTDYEISYKLNSATSIGTEDDISGLSSYNTVKLPAYGVDEDGRIRFTIGSINRGEQSGAVSITFKVTPLNRALRGFTATITKDIVGKLTPPLNIYNFTGGQQNEQVTLLWQYERDAFGSLLDLDLKEVEIRRVSGLPAVATVDDRLLAYSYATTVAIESAGSSRVNIPIDNYSQYTYLARARDTSGNISDDVAYFTITLTQPQRSTTVATYNEDNPSVPVFSGLINRNSTEYNYPSFSNTINGGVKLPSSTPTDNANGSASGWSVIGGIPTDLLASSQATYVTTIRDFGQTITGSVYVDTAYTQQLQSTYNDQHQDFASYVAAASLSNVFRATGIGTALGLNSTTLKGRYDANNQTWMTGPANGNVWALWSYGRYVGDTANAGSYALIAGIVNASAVALGATYFANGESTGTNVAANLTVAGSGVTLVNLNQYSDTGSTTYVGDLGAVTTQMFMRTATSNPYYANGNVNISAFDSYTVNDGFSSYDTGLKRFRYFQLKFVVDNGKPDEFDFTLDKFNYYINKETTVYSNTVVYSTSPTTVNFASANFTTRPVVSYSIVNQISAEANPAIVVTTAMTNTSVSFKLFASKGTGAYNANSTANVMVTVIGV